jgi:hypothetical protein
MVEDMLDSPEVMVFVLHPVKKVCRPSFSHENAVTGALSLYKFSELLLPQLNNFILQDGAASQWYMKVPN